MKWWMPFLPDELVPGIATLCIMAAGFAWMLQLRITAKAMFALAAGVLLVPVLFDILIAPLVEDLIAQLAWPVLIALGLAIGTVLFFSAIGLMLGRGVRNHVLGDLIASSIKATAKAAWHLLVTLPVRALLMVGRYLLGR